MSEQGQWFFIWTQLVNKEGGFSSWNVFAALQAFEVFFSLDLNLSTLVKPTTISLLSPSWTYCYHFYKRWMVQSEDPVCKCVFDSFWKLNLSNIWPHLAVGLLKVLSIIYEYVGPFLCWDIAKDNLVTALAGWMATCSCWVTTAQTWPSPCLPVIVVAYHKDFCQMSLVFFWVCHCLLQI